MLLKNKNVIKIKSDIRKIIKIFGKQQLTKLDVTVPGDPSSAAFFAALTLLKKIQTLKLKMYV